MQRRTNIQVPSLIILLSIATITVQFLIYYFFAAFYVIWGISCIISLLCCYILVEQTATYEACFDFSLLTLFISLVIIVLSYLGGDQSFLPYTGTMLGIAIINWLIPSLHCFLRNMFDYGTKFDDYSIFFRNDSILFLVFFLGVLIYGSFVPSAFPWAYNATINTANFFPFKIITIEIEDYLYHVIPLSDIVIYLLSRILIYLPYGYFITLLLRKQTRLPRFFALLVLPIFIELLQLFIIPSRCDIDDIIYAFIGGILGSLSFYLGNMIFRAFTGKNFLAKETDYPFSKSNLHF